MFFVMKYTCRELLYSISLTLNIDAETRDVEHNAVFSMKTQASAIFMLCIVSFTFPSQSEHGVVTWIDNPDIGRNTWYDLWSQLSHFAKSNRWPQCYLMYIITSIYSKLMCLGTFWKLSYLIRNQIEKYSAHKPHHLHTLPVKSELGSSAWSNSLRTGNCPAASARRHVIMFPPYKKWYLYASWIEIISFHRMMKNVSCLRKPNWCPKHNIFLTRIE